MYHKHQTGTSKKQIESNFGDFVVRQYLKKRFNNRGFLTKKNKRKILKDYTINVNGKERGIRYRKNEKFDYLITKIFSKKPSANLVGVRSGGHNQMLYRKDHTWLRADPGSQTPTNARANFVDKKFKRRIRKKSYQYHEWLELK